MKEEQFDIETFVKTTRERGLLDSRGREVPDPTPIAPPLGYVRQPTISERIREMVRLQLWQNEQALSSETFEEANDFDDPDEGPTSPFEFDEDAQLEQALAVREQQVHSTREKKAAKAAVPPPKEPSGDEPEAV